MSHQLSRELKSFWTKFSDQKLDNLCIGYTTPTRRIITICTHISSATVVNPRRSRGVCNHGVHILRVGVVYLTLPRDSSTIKGPPPSNDSLHDAYCKKSKTMPDFVAVKEQQVDSYRCSGALLLQFQALLGNCI